ncbi:MAG: ABC transporter ATP-binding protein [Chloroflexota bacterium]
MAPFVTVEDLKKYYASTDVWAADGITFEINEGEIFGLLGPNGAGKTTTISVLSCLIQPTEGDATVGGHSVQKDPMEVKKLIGVIPQDVAVYPTLSGRDNLIFWGKMYNMQGAGLKSRVDEVLERVGLAERADDRVETYSGGMKRRVNIAAGLLHRPAVIYMDEPTVGIDPQSRRRILEMVKELNREGMTILYTTHYMEEAQELSDRVGIIDHGKLIALGTQDELTQMIGRHDSLRLQLDEDADSGALAEVLRGVEGIVEASATDHQIVLLTRRAEAVLPAVVSQASENHVPIRSIDIQEPNLEAVFLHLTGRALRD